MFNNLGDFAFSAFLVRGDVTNFDSDAILRLRAGGELAAIARQGQPAPGEGNDVVFGSLPSTSIVMNGLGAELN